MPLLETQVDATLARFIQREQMWPCRCAATCTTYQFTLLAACSTVHPDTSLFTSAQTPANAGRPYVNGNREQENNFILDGMDNNQVSDNLVGYAPSVDAIQEFNEITSNAPAEFGNYMGGIISTSIKSGTNQFHGDAFEFFRNNVLNANQWSSNFVGAPRAALRWNEFGGVLGGPIKKDKIFFFVDYQGSRFDNPNTTSAISLLTAQERAGNFSAFLQQANPIQLYNPFSLNANGTRVPFAGNIIPSSMLSPMALSIVNSQYYPVPGTNSLNNNYFQTTNSAIDGNQGDAKVDWNIDDKDRLFVRYSQAYINNPGTNSIPLFYNSFAVFPQYNGVIDWTRTISPSLVNDARAGVNYVTVNNGAAEGTAVNFPQTIGFPGATSSILPAMNMSGGYANTIGNGDSYQLFADTVIQYGDTVTWNKGAHNIKFGFQGWRDRDRHLLRREQRLIGQHGLQWAIHGRPLLHRVDRQLLKRSSSEWRR